MSDQSRRDFIRIAGAAALATVPALRLSARTEGELLSEARRLAAQPFVDATAPLPPPPPKRAEPRPEARAPVGAGAEGAEGGTA